MSSVDKVKTALVKRNEEFSAFFAAKDFDGLVGLYLPNAQLMPPGSPCVPVSGIKQFFENFAGSGVANIDLPNEEVVVHGDMAVTRDRVICSKEDGTVTFKGKVIVVWMKKDGQWYMLFDTFNEGC